MFKWFTPLFFGHSQDVSVGGWLHVYCPPLLQCARSSQQSHRNVSLCAFALLKLAGAAHCGTQISPQTAHGFHHELYASMAGTLFVLFSV